MTNRRDFIKKTIVGATALAIPGSLATGAVTSGLVNRQVFKPMPVSCLSFSFSGTFNNGMMDIFHFFETCRHRFGIDAADLWSGMVAHLDDDDYIHKVFLALQERQLVVPNMAADGAHLIGGGQARYSLEDRARLEAIQDRWLQVCKKWGIGFLRLDAGPVWGTPVGIGEEWPEEEFDYLVKRYRQLAQFAYDHGFTVGNENHYGHSRWWPNMKKLAEAIDHPGYGICVHFGAWTPASPELRDITNEEGDKALMPWIRHTHIPTALVLDSPALVAKMNQLREGGYPGYYSAENQNRQDEFHVTGLMVNKIRAVINNWNRGGTGNIFPAPRPA